MHTHTHTHTHYSQSPTEVGAVLHMYCSVLELLRALVVTGSQVTLEMLVRESSLQQLTALLPPLWSSSRTTGTAVWKSERQSDVTKKNCHFGWSGTALLFHSLVVQKSICLHQSFHLENFLLGRRPNSKPAFTSTNYMYIYVHVSILCIIYVHNACIWSFQSLPFRLKHTVSVVGSATYVHIRTCTCMCYNG